MPSCDHTRGHFATITTMKNSKLLLPLVAITTLGIHQTTTAKGTKGTNIIIINLDDVGYGDFSHSGAVGYLTPNIDRMAAEGMRFTQFLAAAPSSGPSRAGLMSGCYPSHIGFNGNLLPGAEGGLDTEVMTIAELLKQRDYVTAAFGKWHLGERHEYLPLQRGFDEFFGLPYSHDMWLHHPENDHYKFGDLPSIRGNEVVEYNVDPSRYTTEYTEGVIEFIERNRKRPFFIYLAHPMAHTPLGASDRFKGRSEQGLYGDVMMELDWSVAEILKTLRREGIEQNTLVVLTSDNGPALMYGNHAGSTNGLREGKSTSFEGGHRVPCVVYWRGVVEPGSVCNKLASNIDLFATAAEISGAPLPDKGIDGVSLMPLLRGEQGANPRKWFTYGNVRAISNGGYKLIYPHSYKSNTQSLPGKDGVPGKRVNIKIKTAELYDLRRDAGERYNIIEQHPEVVAELEALAQEH